MTWLVTGAAGMLGTDLVDRLRAGGHDVVAASRADLDLCAPGAARDAVRRIRPSVVVNCAAWTAVDDAEAHEKAALAVNGTAVGALAEACADGGAALVQISTDYVLDGRSTVPCPEDAPAAPVNAYGRTKLAGERAALAAPRGYVVRTAWLYGAHGPNFVRTMARLAAERDTVQVVDDQHGQPTWTGALAEQIIALVRAGARPGVYHGTAAGATTWYGLAREVFTLLGLDPERVRPAATADFPRPAPRPAYSVLGHDRWAEAGLKPMPHWRDSLHEAWPTLL
ncbi:dTDP-4-dehydrorhamnose reductase [Actinomadura fibrosa]|uniref:dTDP-4-dehydrorhamnose reductase n=1 Tax=Actinomadura fibrosa TaxID=111802 RepID=A0ABW2XTY1_9ACTN|nr:dTDP-4-dehydrorhamnose reductase [Actinomadura fibrosa]